MRGARSDDRVAGFLYEVDNFVHVFDVDADAGTTEGFGAAG